MSSTSSRNGVRGACENGKSDQELSLIKNNSYRTSSSSKVQLPNLDVDIILVIGQYLRDMGLRNSVECLMKESGLRLDHPLAGRLREHILNGVWDEAEKDLEDLQPLLSCRDVVLEMRFMLLEQKYLELLECGSAVGALEVLQRQLTPLKYNVQRVHQLSSYVMCGGGEELRQLAGWSGDVAAWRGRLLTRLQAFLPASVVLPSGRLYELLQQAVQLQCSRCQYHNTTLTDWHSFGDHFSLLTDHSCSKDDFPTTTVQTLSDHDDEVWFCTFSPDGNSLASGSKDGTIIIWDIDRERFSAQLRHTLQRSVESPHEFAVCCLDWSPDSRYLLAAHESPDVFIWDAVRGSLEKSIAQGLSDTIVCAHWHPSGDRFVCGGTHGEFYLYDMHGTLLDRWENVRVRALAFMGDGASILAFDTLNRVCAYRQGKHRPQELLTESSDVVSMCVNQSGTLAVLNMANEGIHMWNLQDRTLVRIFQGMPHSSQGTFTVHSCFGGVNEDFIASGSEENNVYVWHVQHEQPVAVLRGHANTVSCVAWNPRQPAMLASCSDDSTVRLWAPATATTARTATAATATNGAVHNSDTDGDSSCNGGVSGAGNNNNNNTSRAGGRESFDIEDTGSAVQ